MGVVKVFFLGAVLPKTKIVAVINIAAPTVIHCGFFTLKFSGGKVTRNPFREMIIIRRYIN